MTIVLITIAFVASWAALAVAVIRPKFLAYRDAAGLHARIADARTRWHTRLALRTKGAKVAMLAFLTSAAPIITIGYDKLAGADWEQLRHAKTADIAMFALGIIGPMAMAALHNATLAEAQAADPVKPEA